MQKLAAFALASLTSFALCNSALAVTYYVAPSGSDLNPGSSPSLPWRTIQMGANTAAAGDLVLVQPGIYDELVGISQPGVTFRANGPVTNAGTFWLKPGANNTVIDGFEMTGQGSNKYYGPVWFDKYGVTNAWIINNRIHDTPNLRPMGPVAFDIDANYSNSCSHCVISNNTIYNWGGAGIGLKGFGQIAVNNWMSNSYGGDCFNLQGQDHVIRGNFCTQIGCGVFYVGGCGNTNFNGFYADNTPERLSSSPSYNIWTNTSPYHVVSSGNYASYGWSNVVNIVDATHTHVYASAASCDSPWTMYDPLMISPPDANLTLGSIEHPDLFESMGPLVSPASPMMYLMATNMLIENNRFVNCPGGSTMLFGANWTNLPGPCIDWTFRNNIWAWVEASGACDTPRVKVYNNTFYQCCTNGGTPLGFYFYDTNYYDPRGMAFFCEAKSNAFIGCGRIGGNGWYSGAAYGDWATSDWRVYPLVTVFTNCNWNYVGETDGTPKGQGSGYPTSNPFNFSEPNGLNGGNVNLANTISFYPKYGSVLNALGIGAVPFDPNLVVWLDFDGGSITPNNVLDETGYGHDAWNMEGANWIYPTNGPSGNLGGFWYTNGVSPNGGYPLSTYLAITNVSGLTNIATMTLSVWTRTDPTLQAAAMEVLSGGYSVQYSGNPAACSNSWDFRRYFGPNFVFRLFRSDIDTNVLSFPNDVVNPNADSDLTQTNWHHYAVTVDCVANQIIGYHDGVAFQTNTVDVPYLTVYGGSGSRWLCVGAEAHNGVPQWGSPYTPNDAYFAGGMDDLRIYNRTLSASEIGALYSGKTPAVSTTGPVVNRPSPPSGLRILAGP